MKKTLVASKKLTNAGPGQSADGWTISVCNQPPRPTQPGHPLEDRRNRQSGTPRDALPQRSWFRSANWCLADD